MEFWALLANNSSQLNLLLTAFTLILAIVAASYAKKQIQIANDQRIVKLRLDTLERANRCLISVLETKHLLGKIKASSLLRSTLNEDDNLPGFEYSIKEYFNYINEPIKNIKESTDKIVLEINEEWSELNLQRLEFLNKHILFMEASLKQSALGAKNRLDDTTGNNT